MRKLIVLLTMVCAFTYLSLAQTSGASGSTDKSGAQAGSSDQSTSKPAGHKKGMGMGSTLTGCLSGPNDEGVYELKSGKRNVEVGGLDDLSKHVGHQVRLHGMWAKSGSEIGEKEASEGSEKKEGKEEKGERHFKVTSIDHMSDTCPAGASGMGEAGEHHHHKKGSDMGSSGMSQPSPTPKQ